MGPMVRVGTLFAPVRTGFGIFLDSAPDRWGRVLMERREALPAYERWIAITILDTSLAHLHGFETRVLVQALKRNPERFPADFCFQLSAEETRTLKSQSVISSSGLGGRRTRPYAFTEQGVAS
jgi:hypothetical protein